MFNHIENYRYYSNYENTLRLSKTIDDNKKYKNRRQLSKYIDLTDSCQKQLLRYLEKPQITVNSRI